MKKAKLIPIPRGMNDLNLRLSYLYMELKLLMICSQIVFVGAKAVLKLPFPFAFKLDIGANGDLNLNSARDQIIYDEKWLIFENNLYRIVCKRLKESLSVSEWEIVNEIIQKSHAETFKWIANSF